MNGRSAGGFRKLAPYSDVQDGLFDILIFKRCPLIEIMPLLVQVWNGEHPKSAYIEYFQASRIEVSAENLVSSDLDGEPGPHFPLTIQLFPKKLSINVRNTTL
jgi:diacylglycerol kinase family enzyme